ncbi:MAG: NYN domain-containing protein [Kiritimatiellaeota bacterium]|nr:NYN domain-containing protein [Kiritimatiellota bacterium]
MSAPHASNKLLRIGVFYDGNFFHHVSNYYKYIHERRRRISIPGLHEFIRQQVAECENTHVRYCEIVDAHFFRGRLSAREADARQRLFSERAFDDILMSEGVTAHYMPVRARGDTSVTTWLALEALEQMFFRRFEIVVLIAGDSDFLQLVRKINALGARVMLLGFDFKYTDDTGQEHETVTSARLVESVTYPVRMSNIITEDALREDPLYKMLFTEIDETRLPREYLRRQDAEDGEQPSGPPEEDENAEWFNGEILSVKEGFGFIRCDKFPDNVFFHWTSVAGEEIGNLVKGDHVNFTVDEGPRGAIARRVELAE